ncbi:hypothetical protein WISP_03377 [Willisornis vidua]|uniref:Uncharacterized protein n=1 Tax=Willisornis vidua TaxID=1566151 RepID=A0ABQ9DZF2_9PASS|nr:hypothetical protein WISP_03377 [Willisornis vidua]
MSKVVMIETAARRFASETLYFLLRDDLGGGFKALYRKINVFDSELNLSVSSMPRMGRDGVLPVIAGGRGEGSYRILAREEVQRYPYSG